MINFIKKNKFIILSFFIILGFVFILKPNVYEVNINTPNILNKNLANEAENKNLKQEKLKENLNEIKLENDFLSAQLKNPPKNIYALYANKWSAGLEKKLNYLITLIKKNNLNSIVIDIKDYSGYLSYKMPIELAEKSGALNQISILDPNKLIKKLHEENIYVIARITVFQDPIISNYITEYAVKNKSTGGIWKDNKGLSWIDPAAKDYWNYILDISKDALSRGFDELNFDYIRFPSDGKLDLMSYSYYDEKTPKNEVIKEFFKFLRENLAGAKISADIFGLTTIDYTDLGIGQIIEDAYLYFDVVAPMVYPSHFAPYSFGYKNPSNYPYEVISKSMGGALKRLEAQTSSKALLRPWLQVFDLGAKYDKNMIEAQIKAVEDVLGKTPYYNGYFFWDPENNYLNLPALEK
jgi:hypothetical protein